MINWTPNLSRGMTLLLVILEWNHCFLIVYEVPNVAFSVLFHWSSDGPRKADITHATDANLSPWSRTSSIGITWGPVRNANPQASLRSTESGTLGLGLETLFEQTLKLIVMVLKFEIHVWNNGSQPWLHTEITWTVFKTTDAWILFLDILT